jgi:hypothetical protein
MQATSGICPVQLDEVIRGWGQYKDQVELLPASEQEKITQLAELIAQSFITPGCVPLGQIAIIGHADKDFHGAAFEKKVSDERATSVAAALGTALINAFKALGIGHLQRGAIAFIPSPIGVGSTEPDPLNVPRITDRTLNRRVTIHVTPRGAPVPPPPPDPDIETKQRARRCVGLLDKRSLPSKVQTDRVKCIFNKLANNPNVKDRFVDGDLTIVRVRGKLVNGLQDINRNYGVLTEEEREVFFSKAGPIVLSDPRFAQTASDDEVTNAMNDLDVRIQKAIGFIDAHLGINGIASDNTKILLNDEISKLQKDPNSIYSCL